MFPMAEDFARLSPELVLCLTGIVVMVIEPFLGEQRRKTLLWLSGGGAGLALLAVQYAAFHRGTAFSGLLRIDPFSIFFHILIGLVALLVILTSSQYLERENIQHGEYFALVLFAAAGMGVMASSTELMTAFVGLEVSSISTYILAGYRRDAPGSNEAAMKYFLLGSFATAFFLYGVALLYGATGTTRIEQMMPTGQPGSEQLLRLGMALVLVGLSFKVAAAPFQLWTPDVYQGAPTPVTALMASGPKAAAFALLLRILLSVNAAGPFWFWALWISAALTMVIGNLAALVQTNIKRMLAYSSIAHAGYILVALAAAAATDNMALGAAAVLYYLAAYALMKLGAFAIVTQMGGVAERRVEINDLAGLGTRQPLLAACFSVLLLSLLGLPVTAGFLGKFYIFNAALASQLVGLAVLLGLASVVASYYYLRVLVVMYMREPEDDAVALARIPCAVVAVLVVTVGGTLYLGLFPAHVMALAMRAAAAFPPR
jgi:NADH-quinone oxidoreductase subunit N